MVESWMGLVPYAKQLEAYEVSKTKRHFAYRMEQGTGKTKISCDKAIHLFLDDKIDALVVVAPNGVHRNWIEREVPKHFRLVPFKWRTLLWTGKKTKAFEAELKAFMAPNDGERVMRIIAINIEALRRKTGDAEKYLRKFLPKFRAFMLVDESSNIKSISAAQTRRTTSVGRLAECRAILSGTMITQGPLDAYAQFNFLKVGALGYDNWTAFKSYYAEWQDKNIPGAQPDPRTGKIPTHKDLVRYKNMDELKRRMDEMSFVCRKVDMVDLPDKVYEPPRLIQMTEEQKRLYQDALKEILIWLDEHRTLTIRHALTRLLRLSQITGGHLPSDEEREAQPIEGPNPKIDGMMGIIEELEPEAKVIVWSRFVPELRLIARELNHNYKGGVSRWWGEIKEDVRSYELDCFMNDPKRRFWVGQQHSGGYGLTLTAATNVIYYSNDFSYEARAQSEDRAHRIGQTNKVTYWDLAVPGTIDMKVLAVLRDKREMAEFFSTPGDIVRWLDE